jgi:hypothetical protein
MRRNEKRQNKCQRMGHIGEWRPENVRERMGEKEIGEI